MGFKIATHTTHPLLVLSLSHCSDRDEYITGVTYQSGSVIYAAYNCTIKVNHTQMWCRTAPGVGTVFKWTVEIGLQATRPVYYLQTTSYAPPVITGDNTLSSSTAQPTTAGGTDLVLYGYNFGARLAGDVSINFDGTFIPNATVTVDHSAVTFKSLPTDKSNVSVTLTVQGQTTSSWLVGIMPPTFSLAGISVEEYDEDTYVPFATYNLPSTVLRAMTTITGQSFGSGVNTTVTIGAGGCVRVMYKDPLVTTPVFSDTVLQCIAVNTAGNVTVTRSYSDNGAWGSVSSNVGVTVDITSAIATKIISLNTSVIPTAGGAITIHGNAFGKGSVSNPDTFNASSPCVSGFGCVQWFNSNPNRLGALGQVYIMNWTTTDIIVIIPPGTGAGYYVRVII